MQRRHDPRKNDLRASGFAELPPGPAKLVPQPPWRHQASCHSVSMPSFLAPIKEYLAFISTKNLFFFIKFSTWWNSSEWYINILYWKVNFNWDLRLVFCFSKFHKFLKLWRTIAVLYKYRKMFYCFRGVSYTNQTISAAIYKTR